MTHETDGAQESSTLQGLAYLYVLSEHMRYRNVSLVAYRYVQMQIVVVFMSLGFIGFVTLLHIIGKVRPHSLTYV